MKKITVFGATGMLGKPVTKELMKAGFEITALVRNIDKARKELPSGVNFVKGDLENKSSIAESLKNAEAIYISISTLPTDKENQFNAEMGGLDNILEAAKQNGHIKQIVYLSSLLARNYQGSWWVMKAKKSATERIKKNGIPYTIFYPSNFMENFPNGMVRNNKISFPQGSSNQAAYWIAGSDFGKQVVQCLLNPQSFNQEYPAQGPEPLTMEQASRKYAMAYRQSKISVGPMPIWMMKLLGLFIPQMNYLSKLMDIMIHNSEPFESENTWNTLSTPQTTLEKFAQENA